MTRKIVYQGALDDQSHYESQKPEASKRYLAEALDAVLARRPVAVPVADSLGCLITRLEPARPLAASHYSTRVAPVIRAKCVTCHRPQGAGPFAFTGYDAVGRWSAMAKETILAGRMAPHDADPEIGQFAFNGALTGREKRDLVTWFDAGAPRGDGPDALEVPLPAAPEWPDGPPDLVLEVPASRYPRPESSTISTRPSRPGSPPIPGCDAS